MPQPREQSRIITHQLVRTSSSFAVNDQQRELIRRLRQRFPIVEILNRKSPCIPQVAELYEHAKNEKRWKYDPPEMVLDGIGKRFRYYHILAALEGEKVIGTVRAVLLPTDNYFVFGSCLVVHPDYRGSDLAILLIMAALSIGRQDYPDSDLKKGAVLGVDDNPAMRRFHARWGVRYIHKNTLPFRMPSIDGTTVEERVFGIRNNITPTEIEVDGHISLRTILAGLRSLQLALGYPQDAVENVYEDLSSRLSALESIPLFTADEYIS